MLFFLLSVTIANHLFAEENKSPAALFRVGVSKKFLDKVPHLLSGISSLFVLLVPFKDIQLQNSSIFATFQSLSPILLLKIVLGLFLLSIFPGYVLYKRFLKGAFSYFEKIGLILALSYCVNAILGLLLSNLNSLSPLSYLSSLWLFVIVIEASGRISKRNQVQTLSSTYSSPWEILLLLLTTLTLLLGSYSLVMSLGPISGIIGGDIARYMTFTNESFNLGISSYIPWLESYLVMGRIVTDLPLIYVYSVIQYLVLLIPISVFFFMKTLFPQQKKAAGLAAFMVSVLYGMSGLPFSAKLIATPSLFTGYRNGAVQSTMRVFIKIFWANTQSYILWDRTIEYGLGLIALGFLFRYLQTGEKKENFTNLLLGALLLNAAIFTHNIFLSIPILVAVTIFSLLQHISKMKLSKVFIVTVSLFFLFTLISRSLFVDQLVTSFIYSYFSIVSPSAGSNIILLLSALLCIYVALLFSDKLKFKSKITRNPYILAQFQKLRTWRPTTFGRWAISLLFILLALYLCYLNYDNLTHITMGSPRPWYVWVAYFGLQIPLIIVYLPRMLNKCDRKSTKFLWVFAFSVLGTALLSYLGLVYFMPENVGSLYLFFMAYPLSCLAALALSVAVARARAVPTEKRSAPKIESTKKAHPIPFSTHKRKTFYIMSTFLVISMAASFLSYTYSIAVDFPKDQYVPRLSPSEAKVLQWMYNSLPRDSVVMALSKTSYQMLSSILPNKILPIFLGSEDPEGGTWARNAVMDSELPEAVLSSLYQLGSTQVFVGSADYTELLKSNTTFASLLKIFPGVYASENVKLYEVPRILYEDSNYHVVSGLWDYPMKENRLTFEKDYSPITLSDDAQSTFWSARALREGMGSIGVPILSDDSLQKINGTDSLEIDVTSGTYGAWQINHKYETLQDWSSQDYIAFYWYGANTSKTLSLEIQSDIVGYNHYRYDFTENWTGWKRVVAPLRNPTEASTPPLDLARIDDVTLGFWLSSNVEGTFWLDRVIIDVGQWIEQDSTIPSNQLLTEMLLRERLPYSAVSEDSLNTLTPGHIYIFPFNPHIPQDVLKNLNSLISEGAHVIFTNPLFSSYNENWQRSHPLPSILNYTIFPNTSTDIVSEILYDEGSFNCSLRLPHIIHFENKSELEIIASFKLSNNSTAPYIVRETIGHGSITFIDLFPLTELPDFSRNEVLNLTMQSLLNLLPAHFDAKTPQYLPIPSQTFADIAFRGSTYDLWRNEDLRGKLMFYDQINIQGDFSILSDYLYGKCDQLYVKNLQITQIYETNLITETMLYDMNILGVGKFSFSSSKAELINYPTGLYNLINVTSDSNSSLQNIELTEATIMFKRTADGESEIYSGDLMIIAFSSNSLTIRTKQPQFVLNGSVEGRTNGAFIYNKYYFYARAEHESSIKGDFTLEVLYSSGITFTQLQEIKDLWEIRTNAS